MTVAINSSQKKNLLSLKEDGDSDKKMYQGQTEEDQLSQVLKLKITAPVAYMGEGVGNMAATKEVDAAVQQQTTNKNKSNKQNHNNKKNKEVDSNTIFTVLQDTSIIAKEWVGSESGWIKWCNLYCGILAPT